MKFFLVFLFCCGLGKAYSQHADSSHAPAGIINRTNSNVQPTDGDTIVVRKDGRLDMLNAIQTRLNKKAARMTYNGLYHGYRLQVLSTQSREQAFDLKASLLQRFPEQKAYTIFQSPYFKVRFGNFIDRDEAERYKRTLSSIYPQVIYIVNDNIEYTPKDEDITSE